MNNKLCWGNCLHVTMSISDNILKSLSIDSIKHIHTNAINIDIDNFDNNKIFYVQFEHHICKVLYIKGLNFLSALETVKNYVDNMGIQYDTEIFGGVE